MPDLGFPAEWKVAPPRLAEEPKSSVDNRRTFCDHCSLRKDLPGFIGWEHASANKEAIESGALFPCHMINDPLRGDAKTCLGAALASGANLAIPPREGQPEIYDSLEEYRQTQAAGRKRNDELMTHADNTWVDREHRIWYGWWAKAPAGNWRYLLTTLQDNANDSVYLFFDQCEELFGPMEKL